jgi:hypothetical protein
MREKAAKKAPQKNREASRQTVHTALLAQQSFGGLKISLAY